MKKAFHVLMASAVFAFAVGGEAAQIAFKKFESIPGGEAEVASFVCSVVSGVYSPGESVEVRLKVKAAKADVSVALQVRNFAGREIYRSGSRKLTEEMRTESFALPPAEELGLFTVSALFSHNARIVGYTETAYAVAPPPTELEDRDAFFVVDKNFALPELLPEMKRFGFGTAFVTLPDMAWAIHTPAEKREAEYAKFAGVEWMKELKVDGFHLMGAMRPNMKRTPKPTARIKKGLFALTDQDLETVRDHSRRMAELLKGCIPVWIIQEEFDAIHGLKDCRDDLVNYLLANALVTRAELAGIREGAPGAEVGILGICCNDYMWQTPKFEISKMVLGPNRGRFDFVALDAYTAGWNACRGPYRPPEDLLGTMLRDAAELSHEYGGKWQSANVERCHALDYAAATDSDMCRQQAAMTARSMIVNKAVAECRSYTLHLLCLDGMANGFLKDKKNVLSADKMLYDLGVWKSVKERFKGPNVGFVPRPSLVAAGTTARELAFTTDPADMPLKDGAYACVFTRERTGVPIAALWSTNTAPRAAASGGALGDDGMNDPDRFMRQTLSRSERAQLVTKRVKISLNMPCGGTLTDIMGNSRSCPPGKLELELDEMPVFVTYNGSRNEFDRILQPLALPGRTVRGSRSQKKGGAK